MDAFPYRGGQLMAENVPLDVIAETYGTPVYVYSSAAVLERYQAYADAFTGIDAMVCYGVKANSNTALLRVLARAGAGADIVSVGELRKALAAGVPAGRIVFSGVGKTAAEMAEALAAGIMQFNLESVPELEALNALAVAQGKRAPIAFRVNPDVDARTHAKITTGKKENKFGVPIGEAPALYARAAAMPGVQPVAVAVHIGSQLTSLAPYEAAFRKMVALGKALRASGHDIRRLDLGGGLGITYSKEKPPTPAAYARMVKKLTKGLGFGLMLEPGRSIVGNAGILLTRVIYMKPGDGLQFAVVDAAMNDLIRPTLYEAHHDIVPVRARNTRRMRRMEIVGPICESSDYLAKRRMMPPLAAGDLLAIRSAGAYGSVMASTYNSRPLVPEVLVSGSRHAAVRPRQTLEQLLALDAMPAWLDGSRDG
jgi:diaminopimelate decarboxylase